MRALPRIRVSTVVVPATMTLLGAANWWLPKSLDRVLPHLDVEGTGAVPAARDAELQPNEIDALVAQEEEDGVAIR